MNRALRAAAMGVLLFSPIALTACSAGQVTQTDSQDRAKNGGMATAGDITLREARVGYPPTGRYNPGSDAPLFLAIANGGQVADTLLSIDAEQFAGVQISTAATGAAATSSSAGASPTTSAGSSAEATSSASASASASPSPSTSPSTSAPAGSASSSARIPVPADQNVFLGAPGGPTVTLTGLSEELTTGMEVPLTLTFQRAGEVSVTALVGTPTRDLPRGEPFDFHHEEEGVEAGGSGD